MVNLPLELIHDILLRLPVKSLLRFRCVCKSFCALIESQSFINSHFLRSSENKIHRKLIHLGTDKNCPKVLALEFNDDFQQEVVLDKCFNSELTPYFFSYCNGLVLLCIDKLSLWNPSTRKYRILPALPVKRTRNLNFALGYDPITEDYKAVVIISKKGLGFSQVWIFELRSNCWRRIQDFPYVGYGSSKAGSNGGCFVDGALHFMCYQYHMDVFKSYIAVAFDVATETFSIVEPVDQTGGIPIRLLVFGGCLSISFWSMSIESGVQVEIYVRKKDGDVFTWTRLYFVTPRQVSGDAFGCFSEGRVAYSKEGDKVFVSSKGKLCSYDLKEKTLQEIIEIKDTNHLNVFSCIESLVCPWVHRKKK